MAKNHLILLSGGSGKRVWPLSTNQFPKQFSIHYKEECLFEHVLETYLYHDFEEVIITTNQEFQYLTNHYTQNILGDDQKYRIIIEPEQKGTFIPIMVIAYLLSHSDDNLLITPTDHYFNSRLQHQALIQSILAEGKDISDYLMIIGSDIQYISQEFGYINYGAKFDYGSDIYLINSFTEKPQFNQAKYYYNNPNNLWNTGIIYGKAKVFIDILKSHNLHTYHIVQNIAEALQSTHLPYNYLINQLLYQDLQYKTIDQELLEKHADHILVKKTNFSFLDLGNWQRISDFNRERQGISNTQNLIEDSTNVHLHNSSNCDIYNKNIENKQHRTLIENINNLLIYQDNHTTYISDKNSEQTLYLQKKIQQNLKSNDYQHYKPWGYYQILIHTKNYCLKKIIINPQHSTSLQYHIHRSETLLVITGQLLVIRNKIEHSLSPGEIIHIEKHDMHQLFNPSDTESIEIMELQYGDILSEDDIIRVQDPYYRTL